MGSNQGPRSHHKLAVSVSDYSLFVTSAFHDRIKFSPVVSLYLRMIHKKTPSSRTRLHSSKQSKKNIILLFVGIIAVLSIIVFGYKLLSPTPKAQVVTELHTMQKIPPDVKKVIAKQIKTASISATLQVPLLLYHYVEYVQDKKDTERQKLDVTPYIFEKQIQTLLDAGYTFITAKDLGDILDGKKQMPQKPIILTFDDGHWDLDTTVLPILKKYNVHATAYIVPGFIGGSDFLSQKQLQDVIKSGLVEIGAHTVHHISLKGLFTAKAQYEILESKRMLEKGYHIKVYSFAYPYGSFDQQAITLVKQDGFTTAASTIPGALQGNINRYFLYRVRPGSQTDQYLLNYLDYWDSVPKKLSDKSY